MAVYTEVADEDLEAFLANYDLGQLLSFKGIAEGVENSNFLLRTAKASYILTLYEKRVAEADQPFFLGLMEHLSEAGISCPTPIHGRDGLALRKLCGRPAALVSFLDGLSLKRIAVEHCRGLGAALAELHEAGRSFGLKRPNSLSVDSWRPLFAESEARADEVRPGLAAELTAELDDLERCWPRALPQGVIHADLFPDNVFFLDGEVTGLIDFYFACNDALAYDLAVCLNAWCFEADISFNATKARALISGYRARRDLSAPELEALPVLARGAALRFLLTRLYDWLNQPPGALVKPKDPIEYCRKLAFHRGLSGPGAYGL